MYGVGLDYELNCILHMLKIFSRGREPEVEGDDSLVVLAVGKRERAIYLKRWRRRWRKSVNVVTPITIVSRPQECMYKCKSTCFSKCCSSTRL